MNLSCGLCMSAIDRLYDINNQAIKKSINIFKNSQTDFKKSSC